MDTKLKNWIPDSHRCLLSWTCPGDGIFTEPLFSSLFVLLKETWYAYILMELEVFWAKENMGVTLIIISE